MGGVSGRIGGSGANENMELTNTIKTSMKISNKMLNRSCTSYAAKQIVATKSWRNNKLAVNTWGGSVRFAAGCGVSGTVVSAYGSKKNSHQSKAWNFF